MSTLDHKPMQKLYRAILKLETVEDCEKFLDDLCTIKELHDLSQRYEVAEMLDQGLNYGDISKATGASTATICRVSKCLNYGENGYRLILDRMQEEKND